MAKSSLPRIDGTEAIQELPKEKPSVQTVAVDDETTNYQLNLAAFTGVNVSIKSRKHREMFRDLFRNLQDSGAQLDDGTYVTDKSKAVIWLIEHHMTN